MSRPLSVPVSTIDGKAVRRRACQHRLLCSRERRRLALPFGPVLCLMLCFISAHVYAENNRSGHFFLDYPLQSLRFFKLPESYEIISFDFDKKNYIVWRYTGNGNYYPVRQNDSYLTGRFEIDADSVIRTDKKDAPAPMIIGLNDGTDSRLKIEAYWNSNLRPIADAGVIINCTDTRTGEVMNLHGGWTTIGEHCPQRLISEPLIRPVIDGNDCRNYTTDTLDISDLTLHNLEIRISGYSAKIDMEAKQSDGLLTYYPIYLLQNKPLNKLSIFTDLDFGACSGEYVIENNDVYIVKSDRKIKLVEVIPGEDDGLPYFSILPEWSNDSRLDRARNQVRKPKRVFEFNFMKSLEVFPACFELSFSHYGTP